MIIRIRIRVDPVNPVPHVIYSQRNLIPEINEEFFKRKHDR
jgi:hypothetical protein